MTLAERQVENYMALFFLTCNQLLGATAEAANNLSLPPMLSFFGRGWIDLKAKALFGALVPPSCAGSSPGRGRGELAGLFCADVSAALVQKGL